MQAEATSAESIFHFAVLLNYISAGAHSRTTVTQYDAGQTHT